MKNFLSFLSENQAVSVGWQGITLSVLCNPKPALISETNREVVDKLVDDLRVVTAESFGVELDNKSRDGVRDHIVNVDSLAFLHNGNEVLGFASSKIFPEDGVFYLHGVAIAKSFKGSGGGIALTRALMEAANLPRIAFTTQNPIMFCLLRSLSSVVYPSPDERETPGDLRELGNKLISGRQGNFDPRSFTSKGIYGKCLYDAIPASRDTAVNKWFEEALEIEGGLTRNAFLFIANRKM